MSTPVNFLQLVPVDGCSQLSQIERNDALRRVTQIQFSNGTKLRKTYSGFSNRIESLVYVNQQDEVVFSENYNYNTIHQTTSRSTVSKLKEVQTEEFSYDAKTHQMQKPTPAFEVVRELGQVKKIDTTRLNWFANQLTQIGSVQIYSNAVGEWMAACSQNQCLTKIDSDRYVFNNKTLSILRVDGSPLVFFYNQKQYQILTDKLGSVRALVDDQGTLLWQRQYSAFGEKSVIYNPNLTAEQKAEAIETQKMLIWGYAGLVELPFQLSLKQNVQVYLSQTRAYSPQIGEWLSADDFVKWQPNKLATMPENTHPHRYARNQPLDYVDPSGKWVHLGIGAGAGAAMGMASAWDSNQSVADNLSSGDVWASTGVGAFGGFLGATGIGGVSGAIMSSMLTEAGLQAVKNNGMDLMKIGIAGAFGGFASKFGAFISKNFNFNHYRGFNPNVSATFGMGTIKGMDDIIENSVLMGKAMETTAGSAFEAAGGLLSDRLDNYFNGSEN